jgi:hypothetical protein
MNVFMVSLSAEVPVVPGRLLLPLDRALRRLPVDRPRSYADVVGSLQLLFDKPHVNEALYCQLAAAFFMSLVLMTSESTPFVASWQVALPVPRPDIEPGTSVVRTHANATQTQLPLADSFQAS